MFKCLITKKSCYLRPVPDKAEKSFVFQEKIITLGQVSRIIWIYIIHDLTKFILSNPNKAIARTSYLKPKVPKS
jgi:hypothetical protein